MALVVIVMTFGLLFYGLSEYVFGNLVIMRLYWFVMGVCWAYTNTIQQSLASN
jgi:hypothetical protein